MKSFLAKNRWAPTLAVVMVGLLFFGWHTGALRRYYRWAYYEVPVYSTDSRQADIIREYLIILNQPVKNAVTSIDVVEHPPFLYPAYDDALSEGGYCDVGDRRVFIKPQQATRGNIFHEITHAYCFALSVEFMKEWREIAKLVYLETAWEKNIPAFMPHEGLLTPRGAASDEEDVAEYGREAFSFLADQANYRGWLVTLPLIPFDPRYRQKIDLMYQWRFFTNEQYQKLVVAFFSETPHLALNGDHR